MWREDLGELRESAQNQSANPSLESNAESAESQNRRIRAHQCAIRKKLSF